MRAFLKVYFDFEDRTEELSDIEKARLLLAMLRYAKTGVKPEISGNERFVFSTFKSDIDKDIAVYNAKIANGNQGGRPAMQKPNETENNLTEPKLTEQEPNETEDNLNAKNKNKNKNKNIKETTLTCSKEKRTRFSPPTLEEVTAYCKERGNTINPQYFIDYYSTRGWQLSKGQNVRDWKACIRTWEQRDNNPSQVQKPKLLRAQMYQQREYNEAEMQKILGVDDLYISDEEYMRRYGVHSPYVDREEHAG